MNVTQWRRSPAALCAAVVLGSGIALSPGTAEARPSAAPPEGLCTSRDGHPPAGGSNIGGTPKRYKWRDTPYVGARFDGCTDTLKLYYGGYAAPRFSFYEVRYTNTARHGWRTWQLPIGERRVATVHGPAHGSWNFLVRACAPAIDDAQGPRACTRWSPQLFLYAS